MVMSKVLRSWRVLILAWTVLLAPQASLVHALSHSLPDGAPHSGEGDHRKHAPAKVCESCLAFAHLSAALPSSFHWVALEASLPAHDDAAPVSVPARTASAYDARAPPADLT